MTPLPPSAFFEVDTLFRRAIEQWVNEGIIPQSLFLQAVLAGDVKEATRIAQGPELSRLPTLLRCLDRLCPESWGTTNAMGEWMHAGGLIGKSQVMGEYSDAVAGIKRRKKE